jgi:hypothetical protein
MMLMLKINGTDIKTPSSFAWGLQDLSSDDSGRTLDGIMHKDRIAQKRRLDCSWDNPTKDEASTILKAVNGTIFMQVTYPDTMSGNYETRTFYVGDRSAPMKTWMIGNKRYSSLSFSFIEK